MATYDIHVKTSQRGFQATEVIGSMKASQAEATAARYVVLLLNADGGYYGITSREGDEFVTWEKSGTLAAQPLAAIFLTYPELPSHYGDYVSGVVERLSQLPFGTAHRPAALCLFAAHVKGRDFVLEQHDRVELVPPGSHLDWGRTYSETADFNHLIGRRPNPYMFTVPGRQHISYNFDYSSGETLCGILVSVLLAIDDADWLLGGALLETLNCPHCLATLQNYQQLHPQQNLAGCTEYPTTVKAEPVVVDPELGLSGILDWCFACRAVTPHMETLSDPQRGLNQQCGKCWAERPLGSKVRYEGWGHEQGTRATM